VLVVLVVLYLTGGHDEPPPAATPTTTPAVPPTLTPSPSPTVVLVERSSDWVTARAPTPTREPVAWPTAAPRVRRQPSPTPSISQCLETSWWARQSVAAWGQVLIEIEAVNRCRRVLEADEVWFWISGYRQGDLIQTARGHAFDSIYPNRSQTVTIGLPGSIDWYDRITVDVMD
jgi:hypothetical protein